MERYGILNTLGLILVGLGLFSGGALLLRAILSSKEDASWGVPVLWKIFVFCTVGGLILIVGVRIRWPF
jgi:hypothetical protein